MEIAELPLDKHYILFTHKGFSTFFMNSTEKKLEFNDMPLRFCFNVMLADKSNITLIQAEKDFYERFKFFAIKYFGMPILADMRLKDVIKTYEKPLESLLEEFSFGESIEIEKMLERIEPNNIGKVIHIKNSPLYVFTRNGMPDV
jgi:hypothetical protein